MKKVSVMYKEQSIIVPGNEVEKSIYIYESNDLVISDVKIEKISSLFEKYNDDDNIYLEMTFRDYLDKNNVGWNYVGDGCYTESEFIEKYKDDVLINMTMDEVSDAQGYYNGYEESYYYNYWDGSNWRTLELENEGEDVIFITTVEEGKTYQIDLYYNIEEKEVFTVLNSYYQGTLLTQTEDVEDERKAIIEAIENLLEKINNEIEHNNKLADKFEGFKITLELNEEELETFNYISILYDYFEKEDNKLYITTQYK